MSNRGTRLRVNASGDKDGRKNLIKPCFDFQKGQCKRGDSCMYSHSASAQSSKPCYDFHRGVCNRGDTCMYSHTAVNTGKTAGGGSPSRILRDNSSDYRESPGTHQGAVYADYLTDDEVSLGLSTGKLLSGTLYVNPRKNAEAYLRCNDPNSPNIDIRIDTEKARNRSYHGDIVVVEVLSEDQWLPWSAMMSEKLGLNDVKEEGNATRDTTSSSISSRQAVEQALWVPQQDMIDAFTMKTKAKAAATSTDMHPIEALSMSLSLQPRATIVAVQESKHKTTHIGSLSLNTTVIVSPGEKLSDSIKGCYFTPTDTRFNKIYIPRLHLPEAFQNNPYQGLQNLYIIDLVPDWSTRSRMCTGTNVRSVGEFGDINTETEALLIQYNCNHLPYTEDAIEPLREKLSEFGVHAGDSTAAVGGAADGWKIPEDEIAKRRDLRNYRIFTIDPPNAKDLDDALHITPFEDGSYELGVHIADVSYFLQPGTSLDDEAQKRATSVYLVQKVIPMLPSILCEQLCSLNANVDRLAFSCIWRMNADGSLNTSAGSKPWFGKTIIRSCAKLDYPTAQRMIDGEISRVPSSAASGDADSFLKDLPESVWEFARRPVKVSTDSSSEYTTHSAWSICNDVCLMREIAMKRRQQRLDNGALVLTNQKLTFKLDSNGNPVETDTYTIRESNQLVEEYMLLANYLVAQELLLKFGEAAFIRNHGNPDASGMKALQDVFTGLGYELDVTSAATIQACLNNVGRTATDETLRIVSMMLAKPVPEAQYIVAGEDPGIWRHYALSIPYYTHFTSPIRRYADVMVHRLLETSVIAENTGDESLIASACNDAAMRAAETVATKCNEMKKASKEAQTRSDHVFFAMYLKDKPLDVSGFVVGIGEKSFTVLVPEYGIEDRLFVENMPGVTFEWNPDMQVLQLYRAENTDSNAVAVNPSHIPNKLTFTGSLHLKMLTSIRVHLSAKTRPPIDVCMSLIGPDTTASSLGPRVE